MEIHRRAGAIRLLERRRRLRRGPWERGKTNAAKREGWLGIGGGQERQAGRDDVGRNHCWLRKQVHSGGAGCCILDTDQPSNGLSSPSCMPACSVPSIPSGRAQGKAAWGWKTWNAPTTVHHRIHHKMYT
jgi:hypothetical protein